MKLTNIDFNKIPLSKEILEKLNKHKPENLYDARKFHITMHFFKLLNIKKGTKVT